MSFAIYARSPAGKRYVWTGAKFEQPSRPGVKPVRFGSGKDAVHVGKSLIAQYRKALKGMELTAEPYRG